MDVFEAAPRIRHADVDDATATHDSEPPASRSTSLTARSLALAPPIVSEALRGATRPLDAATVPDSTLSGIDRTRVRLHTDATAAESARAVRARAYTVGDDIVFGPGEYQPETPTGLALLTHELAHVQQQRSAQHTGPALPLRHDARAEREAASATAWALHAPHAAPAPPTTSIGERALQRQPVDVELETPTPDERERLRRQGIQLPQVSAAALDPRRRSDYIDNQMTAVGFGIYLGGYLIYLDGVEKPVFVPEDHFDFAATRTTAADLAIFETFAQALGVVPLGPWAPGQPVPYAFYRGAGGVIVAPTLFSPDTTPRIIMTAVAARRQLAAQVEHALAVLAMSIVGGMLFRAVVGRILRVGRAPAPVPRRPPDEIAEELFTAHGGSVRAALPRLNSMGLSQEDAAEVLAGLFRRSGRDVGNTVRMPNGDLVLTSATPGVQRPVNIILPGGQVRFGHADITQTSNPMVPFTVTNVVPE